ncbi:NAD(P)-dependent oxidoreductase [Nitratireductor sp. ZSWI3]|uniref:NAD(P)-dependent oxidoreductase n=1 Tax=Nitratireductor sp. ZSWI3 TaxID=2966359 RepID=UPI0021500D00|nr:NAD(P)-dependent oxidoreductase [Nitratireductor sp. ZSWI3]MCR4267685.1 NAD(P)-binding domain-containing protein [Nitratireductor sp. ZSWI3]
MAETGVIEGVYLSSVFDLEKLYGRAFAAHADTIRLRHPHEIEDPAAVRFALCWRPRDDAFSAYPNLGLASSIAAGIDSIVNCPSLPAGALVTRIRDDDQGDLMAGYAAWNVVWHHRNLRHAIVHEARREWSRQAPADAVPPRNCTVGLLGYGLMGRAIARAVTAMGFPVVAAVRNPPQSPPSAGVGFESGEGAAERVAARANILINVLPLTAETRGLIGAAFFARMPKGAALVQLGRGEQLIEKDLLAALDSGQLSGASLDVFAVEPLPPEHPFWADERILVTPHQASESTPRLVAEQVARAAQEFVAGRVPETAVDRVNGY